MLVTFAAEHAAQATEEPICIRQVVCMRLEVRDGLGTWAAEC